MPLISKALDDGQVASSAGRIYKSVGRVARTRLKEVFFFNENTTEETLILYLLRAGGTARKIYQAKLAPNESVHWGSSEQITLESGDELQAETTTASKVNFVLGGVIEDA